MFHAFICMFTVAVEDQILLYSNAKLGAIKGISLAQSLAINVSGGSVDEVMQPISAIERPVALDVHLQTGYIYFSDALKHVISRRKIGGGEVEDVVKSGLYCNQSF
jgi:hypothetical protein